MITPNPQQPANESNQTLIDSAATNLAPFSENPTLDAEVLLCHCLRKSRSFLRAWPEHYPSTRQVAEFKTLVQLRAQGHPVAYLTGQREFWSREFKVSPDVLIPRPETELLIELALKLLPTGKPAKIIDLGTGSGVIAITLAAERPLVEVIAVDTSHSALAIAKDNARQVGAANVKFVNSAWMSNIEDLDFDLVISNPPYIASDDPHLQQGDVRFEPDSALVSAENGLRDIRLIAEQAREHLKPGGHLLVEHGYNQQAAVQTIFKNLNYQQISTHADLSGNPRVTSGSWNPK